jgi:thiamine biosynthesis lipoprotein
MSLDGLTDAVMGTVVTIDVVGHDADARERRAREDAIGRAFDWFRRVEAICTRFDPASELMALTACVGTPVGVSEILFKAIEFACAIAEESGGAFDPTVGRAMERHGFNRNYLTGRAIDHAGMDIAQDVSYRDLALDAVRRTVTLRRPLVLDLGAVAKGLAIDLAARELAPFRDYAIDAGGDLFLGGHNAQGRRWTVGIRHPREDAAILESVTVSDTAVCTSGDYERRAADGRTHHLLDPRAASPADRAASVTVLAPSAMLADALSTAAFVLGPADGLALLTRTGVEGLIVTPDLQRLATPGLAHVVLSHA